MNQKKLWSHLTLDSFNVDISFSKSKQEIMVFLNEKNISMETPTEMQIIVKSKMFSLAIDFFIAFHFYDEKLKAITISPDTALKGSALYSRYRQIQKALENELGKPRNRLRAIMNLLDQDSQLAHWQGNGIKIEHYVLNRFDMEEIIKIEM